MSGLWLLIKYHGVCVCAGVSGGHGFIWGCFGCRYIGAGNSDTQWIFYYNFNFWYIFYSMLCPPSVFYSLLFYSVTRKLASEPKLSSTSYVTSNTKLCVDTGVIRDCWVLGWHKTNSPTFVCLQPQCQAAQDVDKAVSLFESTGRISATVMEAR